MTSSYLSIMLSGGVGMTMDDMSPSSGMSGGKEEVIDKVKLILKSTNQ